jgi:hypothetical protein
MLAVGTAPLLRHRSFRNSRIHSARSETTASCINSCCCGPRFSEEVPDVIFIKPLPG